MLITERQHQLDWLALPFLPIPSWAIIALVLAALLALPIPAAQAAGCTKYDVEVYGDGDSSWYWLYARVPASNFLTGDHTVFSDSDCQTPSGYGVGIATAVAKTGRQAMKICERNIKRTVAEVRKAGAPNTYYCEVGKRKGPKRQRRENLFVIRYDGDDAKGALAQCRTFNRGYPKHERPNHAEPAYARNHWYCYRTWTVSKRYLKQVGA